METPEPDALEINRAKQLIQLIQPITERVGAIVSSVKNLSWIYLGSAFVLWGILFIPFSMDNAWSYAFAVLLLALLCIPAGILLLFHAGLQSVIALPRRLLEKAGVGEASTRSVIQSLRANSPDQVESSKRKLLGTFVELRELVLESKEMLIEYAAILRLANPLVLGIVGIATVAGFCVGIAALIALIVILI